MKKWIVIYLNENSDLYSWEFQAESDARSFLKNREYKSFLIEVDGAYKIEYHT